MQSRIIERNCTLKYTETFEDTKGVIRSGKMKKGRYYNAKKKAT